MSRFVRFSVFGGPEVLEVVDVAPPHPGPGQVRVATRIAGLNPVDWKILAGGPSTSQHGAFALPSGNGNDFAGVIDEVGEGVTTLRPGDRVFGGARFFAQADFIVMDADKALPMPAGLEFEVAGALDIAGRAAIASVRAVDTHSGDTVLVSAAAGGVGVIACQLALLAGATVIGSASKENHEFLRGLGVVPVEYGNGLVDAVRAAAPAGLTAALDCHGDATLDAALELGVAPERINTIAARAHAAQLDPAIQGIGGQAASPDDLLDLAHQVAAGSVTVPIDSVYPLERVSEAYERQMAGHLRGKIILALA